MVIGFFDRLSRPLMRVLDPEDAHTLAIKALRFMPLARLGFDIKRVFDAFVWEGRLPPLH